MECNVIYYLITVAPPVVKPRVDKKVSLTSSVPKPFILLRAQEQPAIAESFFPSGLKTIAPPQPRFTFFLQKKIANSERVVALLLKHNIRSMLSSTSSSVAPNALTYGMASDSANELCGWTDTCVSDVTSSFIVALSDRFRKPCPLQEACRNAQSSSGKVLIRLNFYFMYIYIY